MQFSRTITKVQKSIINNIDYLSIWKLRDAFNTAIDKFYFKLLSTFELTQ